MLFQLGRGTSTFEGLGIAWSIAEFLASNIQCKTLFVTHFHEIADLALTEKFVKNYHLAAITDKGELTLLFQVKPGAVNKSFGIEVAEIAQLPKIVLDNAKNYLLEIEERDGDEQTDRNNYAIKIDEMLERIRNGDEFQLDMLTNI